MKSFLILIFFFLGLSLFAQEELNDGPWTKHYKSGQLWQKGKLKNGKLNGKFIAYHENGTVQAKGKYKDGQKQGAWIWYYDNGQVWKEGKTKDGMEIGE